MHDDDSFNILIRINLPRSGFSVSLRWIVQRIVNVSDSVKLLTLMQSFPSSHSSIRCFDNDTFELKELKCIFRIDLNECMLS
jgi:hypothetical protein